MENMNYRIKPKRWIGFILIVCFVTNNNYAKNLAVYNKTTASLGSSVVTVSLRNNAEDGYDNEDIPWTNMPPEPENQWLKVYTNPYGVELYRDARPINSTEPFILKFSLVSRDGTSVSCPRLIYFRILWDDSNFVTKNIISEQYGLDDVNDPNNIKQIVDVKQVNEQDIPLEDLVEQPPDIVYDQWVVSFYNYADLNRDNQVNFFDFSIFASNYGRTDTIPRDNTNDLGSYADINRSGVVDCNDLMLFSDEWLWDANDPNTW